MAFFKRLFRKKNQGNHCDPTVQEQNSELLLESGMSSAKRMLINKGESDEMEINGYRRNKFKTALTYISFVLTLGISRLIFHWMPHWYLYATSSICSVTQAQSILVIETFRLRKILHVCRMKILTADDVFKFQQGEDNKHSVNPELIEVLTQCAPSLSVNFANGTFKNVDRLMIFSHKRVNYIWNHENQIFEKLTSLDVGVSGQTLHNYMPLSEEEAFKRRAVYGSNIILIERNTVTGLLFQQVLGPYYIFQGFSLLLWFYDNYIYYAAAVLGISSYNIGQSVRQTRETEKRLWETLHGSDMCEVQRVKKIRRGTDEEEVVITTEKLSTECLVPGDILVIPAHGCMMHCDAVLLSGNCVVNEAMLTGESVPVTKTAIPDEDDVIYDAKEHARHSLFSGTKVIQTRYDKGKVLAVVIRTGFCTAKGSLVRSILYPNPIDFKFEKDSYKYVFLTAVIALVAIVYEVYLKTSRGVPASVIILQALDVITISVPPALPSAMTAGYSNAQKRLRKEEIYCIAPRIINVAGSINCVCFDKTGTLTEDGLDLYCVIPASGGSLGPPITDVAKLPYDTFFGGLVSCHSLTIINGEIVGDPLDLKMFESTGWSMKESDNEDNKYKPLVRASFEPPKGTTQTLNGVEEIALLREFPFSSSLQRMGVISRTLDKKGFDYYCKGAPEMLLNFIDKRTLPRNFHEILENYTQEGFRVIAIAHKEIFTKYSKLHKIHREELEVNLEFLGLIVLENRLKQETTASINELNDADIRCVMVTGDNLLTAISVARDCDMLRPHESVITINCDNSTPPNLYFTLNNLKPKNTPNDASVMSNSASVISLDTVESQVQSSYRNGDPKKPAINNNYRFALTGKVWEVIREYHSDELLGRVLTRGTIFARMGPDQKQQLVEELQKLGYYVGMCGDGANDCGALKAAHAGISLSDEESSLASPFNSKRPNISCVVKVIKEGRAALVSSFGIFKYMIFYSMNQLAGVINLAVSYTNFTDFQFLWMDLGITSPFALFFGSNKVFDGPMSKEPPLTSLISPQPIASLFIHLIVSVAFQMGLFAWMQSQKWYTPPVISLDEEALPTYENYNVFITVCLQNIAMALVFSKGKPYRRIIFRNPRVMLTTLITTVITIYLALEPAPFLQHLVGLMLPPDTFYKLSLMLFCLLSFLVAYVIEYYVIDELVAKCTRKVDKSLKYVRIEEELNMDTSWPPLTSPEDFKATASPDNTIPDEPANFVVEKDLKLKNRILAPVVSDYTSIILEEPKLDEKAMASILTEPPKLVNLGPVQIDCIPTTKQAGGGNNLSLKTISENNLNNFEGSRSYQVNTATLNATPSRNPCPNNFQLSLTKSPAQSEDLFSSVPSNFNNISSGSDTFQSFSPSEDFSPSSSSNYNIPDLPRDDTEKLVPITNGYLNGFSPNEDIIEGKS
ncbi:polyamine-transporting ATPase 13A3-like isoform X2 [Coccinella septempunctata]|uniref:polyamine-transporting ATPase 13A3-like isoform X2 n=1 Tax=Coccinella septempunctata TaxID=41139 RepID=UPI001D075C96|nr:polyamine-transporting ATPase 13A3-like isoform X2 [Coccinella septempunctata]